MTHSLERDKANAESRSKACRAQHTQQVLTLHLWAWEGTNRALGCSPHGVTRATRPWCRVHSLCCLELTYLPTLICPVPLTGALSSGALLSSGTACSSASEGRPLVPECWLQGSFTGMWPWVLLLQQSYSLLEHPHLGLVSLHHGHHLRLQLLQFVLMLLLRFLISSH